MSLAPGVRLGAYEILAAIGAGGMGEVYRARDTKLGREVAIKVLPEAFVHDADRRSRFEREARLISQLNHPNICALYHISDAPNPQSQVPNPDQIQFLVLELVEGPTLADRIAQGPIPVDEALPIARQIADALEAAHEQGIIHRDLKPANVKLRPDGTVKVLDFGLAKAIDSSSASASVRLQADLSASPTITSPIAMSGVGVLLGTAAYMAPEQARGKTVDKRADIWAFGCVLYEMLAGTRPFDGEDVSLTLAAIMKSEPDLKALPPALPPAVRSCLVRCLQKDPTQRLRDIGDVRLAMDGAFETAPPAKASTRERRDWRMPAAIAIVTLALGAAAGALAVRMVGRSDDTPRPSRFVLNLPPSVVFRGGIAEPVTISADGRRVVFNARDGNVDRVYTRALDQIEAVPVRGLDGVVGSIFLSPDGEWIGFNDVNDRTFKRIRITGGPVATICKTGVMGGAGFRGASWGTAGAIAFATAASPALMRVAASGGEPTPITKPADGEMHLSPYFLPDGRRLLFTLRRKGSPDHVALLDGDGGEPRVLLTGTFPRYSPSGHLLFVREGTVWAVAFSPDLGTITGNPAPALEDVEVLAGNGVAKLSVADDGTLVYVPGSSTGTQRSLVWVDRSGREDALAAPPRPYTWVRVSRDGTRIAMEVQDPANTDIWTYDIRRGTLDRLTASAEPDRWPLWTPDGKRIVFASGTNLMWKAADGTGDAEPLVKGLPFAARPYGWSGDAKTLVFDQENVSGDTFLVSLDTDRRPRPLIANVFRNHRPAVSPDGRWIAYASTETSREEIFVRPFPAAGSGRWPISSEGGISPVWSPDSRQLFYNSPPENRMFVVDIDATTSFKAGRPQVLFQGPYYWGLAVDGRSFDIAPDGRFLMIKQAGATAEPRIVVVLNWTEELKRLAPTN